MSKTLHRSLQSKIESLQGPEWESSDEEDNVVVADKSNGKKKKSPAKSKKGKKGAKEAEKDVEGVQVIYIGHLPYEFEERDLRTFLSQFGRVERIRVSRSVKTGHARGYAFVKFSEAEVAKVVAETLQGYFLGKRRLVCHLVPDAHSRMFYDTDKVIARKKMREEVEKKQRNRNLANVSKLVEISARLVNREKQKRNKLAELGIDYDFPGYEASLMSDISEIGNKKKKQAEDEEEDDSVTPEEEEPPASDKKKKRKNSKEESSLSAIMDEAEESEKAAKKNKKRKDSMDSTSSKSRKRKDSVGSVGSATSPKKSKRKDSVGSVGSATSPKKSKRKNSTGGESIEASTPTKSNDSGRAAQTEKKKKKKKGKRRTSAP